MQLFPERSGLLTLSFFFFFFFLPQTIGTISCFQLASAGTDNRIAGAAGGNVPRRCPSNKKLRVSWFNRLCGQISRLTLNSIPL